MALFLATALTPAMAGQTAVSPGAVDPPRARVSRERRYELNARVRPLLFWIRRNDVGAARITWRGDRRGAHGYELLVGSDPLKAPRKINRWGYVSEHVSGSDAAIIGVMKQSGEESIAEAEQELAREGQGGYIFKGIRASVSGDRSAAAIVQIHSEEDLTYRDLDALLARLARADAPRRVFGVPDRTAPGLLSAVADMLRETMSSPTPTPGERPPLPQPRTYVYNGRLYVLTLRSLTSEASVSIGERRYGPALDGQFEILNQATRKKTKFSIVYGRSGALAEVPLKIVFRPRWWFEAELVLAE